MLVLSREAGQKIQIGNNVTLLVLSVRKGIVRLGFEAPREIQILRGDAKARTPKDEFYEKQLREEIAE